MFQDLMHGVYLQENQPKQSIFFDAFEQSLSL
ncbi:uncharacterized protein METZ01_LOCUS278427 [marine metagenome]|uniref:Uncharacterized protein n=1 Tax=marine metagenome TaxID=408172 RepID=A0A382KQ22_9ZZZZ